MTVKSGAPSIGRVLGEEASQLKLLAVFDRWRADYNHRHPHSALNDRPPATYAAGCIPAALITRSPPERRPLLDADSLTQPVIDELALILPLVVCLTKQSCREATWQSVQVNGGLTWVISPDLVTFV